MTITPQPSDTISTCADPHGPPMRHGKLIILASVALVVLVGVVAAVIALAQPRPSAHATLRPLTGRGAGTMTLSLTTGAATTSFTGQLNPLGAETGYDSLTFHVVSPSAFTYAGTRTFVMADGDKLYSAVNGTGMFTGTAAKSAETDTITGGTGRLARATGSYTDTVTSIVVSATSTSQVSRFTAVASGQIRY